jgi:hypothetical protein
MPTLYRTPQSGEDLQSELRSRRAQHARVTASIFENPMIEAAIPGASDLSDLQKEAVARHYGAPSGLLDVTCEPEVAAVFAAKASTESEVGYIYAINLVELLSLAGASTSGRIRGGYQLALWPAGVTEIRYLAPNPPDPPTEETAIIRFAAETWKRVRMTFSLVGVQNVARINAQKGVFIAMLETGGGPQARDMWHLLDIVSQKYFFRHTVDGYTPDNSDFCEDNLLPLNDPIAHMGCEDPD